MILIIVDERSTDITQVDGDRWLALWQSNVGISCANRDGVHGEVSAGLMLGGEV